MFTKGGSEKIGRNSHGDDLPFIFPINHTFLLPIKGEVFIGIIKKPEDKEVKMWKWAARLLGNRMDESQQNWLTRVGQAMESNPPDYKLLEAATRTIIDVNSDYWSTHDAETLILLAEKLAQDPERVVYAAFVAQRAIEKLPAESSFQERAVAVITSPVTNNRTVKERVETAFRAGMGKNIGELRDSLAEFILEESTKIAEVGVRAKSVCDAAVLCGNAELEQKILTRWDEEIGAIESLDSQIEIARRAVTRKELFYTEFGLAGLDLWEAKINLIEDKELRLEKLRGILNNNTFSNSHLMLRCAKIVLENYESLPIEDSSETLLFGAHCVRDQDKTINEEFADKWLKGIKWVLSGDEQQKQYEKLSKEDYGYSPHFLNYVALSILKDAENLPESNDQIIAAKRAWSLSSQSPEMAKAFAKFYQDRVDLMTRSEAFNCLTWVREALSDTPCAKELDILIARYEPLPSLTEKEAKTFVERYGKPKTVAAL